MIPINHKVAKMIWKPKILFDNVIAKVDNAKSDKETRFFFNNEKKVMEYTEDLVLTVFCNFKFPDFPFDVQECNLTYGEIFSDSNVSNVICI